MTDQSTNTDDSARATVLSALPVDELTPKQVWYDGAVGEYCSLHVSGETLVFLHPYGLSRTRNPDNSGPIDTRLKYHTEPAADAPELLSEFIQISPAAVETPAKFLTGYIDDIGEEYIYGMSEELSVEYAASMISKHADTIDQVITPYEN